MELCCLGGFPVSELLPKDEFIFPHSVSVFFPALHCHECYLYVVFCFICLEKSVYQVVCFDFDVEKL